MSCLLFGCDSLVDSINYFVYGGGLRSLKIHLVANKKFLVGDIYFVLVLVQWLF